MNFNDEFIGVDYEIMHPICIFSLKSGAYMTVILSNYYVSTPIIHAREQVRTHHKLVRESFSRVILAQQIDLDQLAVSKDTLLLIQGGTDLTNQFLVTTYFNSSA